MMSGADCLKLGGKFRKGITWVRAWIIRQMIKRNEDTKQVEQMSDEELKEFISITDRGEIEELLSQDLIIIELGDAPPPHL
jgi:hypothetical protein